MTAKQTVHHLWVNMTQRTTGESTEKDQETTWIIIRADYGLRHSVTVATTFGPDNRWQSTVVQRHVADLWCAVLLIGRLCCDFLWWLLVARCQFELDDNPAENNKAVPDPPAVTESLSTNCIQLFSLCFERFGLVKVICELDKIVFSKRRFIHLITSDLDEFVEI
ncbi:hypothetical protein T06_8940 [Trichinella sp. T6]|nr:hypothetical protein T06_8940 [Trichinella sp. T6]